MTLAAKSERRCGKRVIEGKTSLNIFVSNWGGIHVGTHTQKQPPAQLFSKVARLRHSGGKSERIQLGALLFGNSTG